MHRKKKQIIMSSKKYNNLDIRVYHIQIIILIISSVISNFYMV